MIPLQCPLKVNINSFEVADEVVYFQITVSSVDESLYKPWILPKRFSNFADLHANLCKKYSIVPARPKKTIFKMKKPEDLNQRRKDLEEYCNKIFAIKDLFKFTCAH